MRPAGNVYQALSHRILPDAVTDRLTAEQTTWLKAHLEPFSCGTAGSGSSGSSPDAAGDGGSLQHPQQPPLQQRLAILADFLIGSTASGDPLFAEHIGCLAPFCQVTFEFLAAQIKNHKQLHR